MSSKFSQHLVREYKRSSNVSIKLSLGFPIAADRLHKKELGGGTILDLGVYTIQMAQLVFEGEMPRVTAAGHLGPGGCDESASITLTYDNGRTATLVTHSRAQLPNEVVCHLKQNHQDSFRLSLLEQRECSN